jgi:hypothetical protein
MRAAACVRLDAEDLKRLQAVPGDVLLITGRRATMARAAQAPPATADSSSP